MWVEYVHKTLWYSFLDMLQFDCQFGYLPPTAPAVQHMVHADTGSGRRLESLCRWLPKINMQNFKDSKGYMLVSK